MAEILSLRPNEHDAVRQLLPWHVNATLSPEETARVEAHLDACEECREDLAGERELAREVALLPLDIDEGWQEMALRMGQDRPAGASHSMPLASRAGPVGWVLGGALAASLALAVGTVGLQKLSAPDRSFHTLGAAATAPAGQVVVLFRPDTSEQQMRTILAAQGARLVDGPTAAGAYLLRIDGRNPAEAISALRQSSQVVLAQPIAPDSRP